MTALTIEDNFILNNQTTEYFLTNTCFVPPARPQGKSYLFFTQFKAELKGTKIKFANAYVSIKPRPLNMSLFYVVSWSIIHLICIKQLSNKIRSALHRKQWNKIPHFIIIKDIKKQQIYNVHTSNHCLEMITLNRRNKFTHDVQLHKKMEINLSM